MSKITEAIENWNRESIYELRDMLAELKEEQENNQFRIDYVDMADLPSEPIPDDIGTAYPVWAMDKHGFCLVGAAADKIEHVDSIRGN